MTDRITLSLVSHTNVGKTTLARTLLGRDVGEVRDAPHVTEFADEQLLLRSAEGDEWRLWDTPGFGDSVRLVRRMRQAGNPLGWFLAAVWDRWRDRPFWASQQALRHVRDRSDVVLYLVNAAEEPQLAGYVAPEMELLAWVGKPVLVLLNQLGAPREPGAEAADVQRWATELQRWPLVQEVLPLDAFARCWVQEAALWDAVRRALPPQRHAAMARLQATWLAQRRQVFEASMQTLAESLARALAARVPLADGGGLRRSWRQLGAALGLGAGDARELERAQRALADCVDDEVRSSTARLIALHGLSGDAGGIVLERVASHYQPRRRVDEGQAALVGGMLSGALTGLAADLAAGGLTLGGGMLAGGLLGALGAAGVARGMNVVRGTDRSWLGFSAEALPPLVHAALLRYLAVAHFGRGRGDWVQSEAPPHWSTVVDQVLASQAGAMHALWQGQATGTAPADLAPALQPLLARCTSRTLALLYPAAVWGEPDNPPS